MEYRDKVLKCIDCGTDFVFTAGEQLFFHDKKFTTNQTLQKLQGQTSLRARIGVARFAARTLVREDRNRTNCSQCGKDTTVPFRPTQGRPVLCRDCFSRGAVASA